ncbi:response regulator [Fischerella thermalis]|jgi:chemotaxis family two-component system response regulator PixG|uniref:Protein PatA n=1 Tax=Fischerella thermalis JSC-11 TaxID=741277 RepID=G6FWE1_9CYAN|nr:response regulator [Fischerella thermalis]EHC11548.1 response regulator receiver protein [Fischerella thermalis JSC-11]PLZ15181.1 response regulator [Fischerella thermalis WC114]PLZ15235.1 response regulator [Fischerella thermalis WC1110]PLZ22961.1 response regulator [Fischerella thermalis WC157]PLZ45759.1 response regulator [Fischerella thermalis WC538]
MNFPQQMNVKNLLLEFLHFNQTLYSGTLDITTSYRQKFRIYYHQGSIIWGTGGVHPHRRFRRHMAQNFPQVDLQSLQWRWQNLSINNWDYQLLRTLHQMQKIEWSQINTIVENTVTEILFDIIQEAHCTHVFCDRCSEIVLDAPIILTNTEIILRRTYQLWQNWAKAGLAAISPNLAPSLNQPEQLQHQVSQSAYKSFINLLNGNYTLYDIAIKTKQNILPITLYLSPHINQGKIQLKEVKDWYLNLSNNAATSVDKYLIPKRNQLVAYVDDSPQLGQTLGKIIIDHGLRFIHIQDSTQALVNLIEQKPDLIFLDLIMPYTSGYEICAQLRKISFFAKTPIIILTGSNGIFDRTRAKVVGSTDFLNKPIVVDQVMAMLNKYLPVQSFANLSKL